MTRHAHKHTQPDTSRDARRRRIDARTWAGEPDLAAVFALVVALGVGAVMMLMADLSASIR